MLVSLLGGLVFIGLTSAAPTAPPPELVPFSIVLESTETGWAARCDSGCQWERLSFTCAGACAAVVDARGVRTVEAPLEERAAFRFRVERTGRAIRATAAEGTVWTLLTWSCDSGTCRARVDEQGVSGVGTAR